MANKTKLELFYALQQSRGHKELLKQSRNAKTRLKTRSRGFYAEKLSFQGFSAKTRDLYVIKP